MKIHISKRNLLYSTLFIPYFEPAYVAYSFPILHKAYYALYVVALGILFFLFLNEIVYKKKKLAPPIIFVISYYVIFILSTFINDGQILATINEAVRYISFFVLCDIVLNRSLDAFLRTVYPILWILVLTNFIFILLHPQGLYVNVVEEIVRDNLYGAWYSYNDFLGFENVHIFFYIPTMLFSYILVCKNNKWITKINSVVVSLACFVSTIVKFKGGATFCMFFFLLLCILLFAKKNPIVLNAYSYLIGNSMLFIGFVFLRLQRFFSFIIVNLLHKDLELSHRTSIWDRAIEVIAHHPLIGVGNEATEYTVSKLGYNSTHSHYLWVLYRGGVLQFSVFAWYIYILTSRLFKYKDKKEVQLTAIALATVMIGWQTEAITSAPIMLLLSFSYYVCNY